MRSLFNKVLYQSAGIIRQIHHLILGFFSRSTSLTNGGWRRSPRFKKSSRLGANLSYYSCGLVLDFIYPPLCLHCEEKVTTSGSLLCDTCGSLFELLSQKDQCPYCFAHEHNKNNPCQIRNSAIYRAAAALEYSGPAATLVKQLKYHRQSHIAKGLGAFLTTQFLSLNWPTPDIIIPVPQTFFQRVSRGYNHSELLAKALAESIGVSVGNVLKRCGSTLPQAAQTKEQRKQLSTSNFKLKKNDLGDKMILLVDDVMTTRATLRACAEVLETAYPKKIYALTVCC